MLCFLLVVATLDSVLGHGNMFHPPAWWDRGSKLRTPASSGCGVLHLGTDNEFSEHHNGKDPDCMPYWYSNGVYIPGDHTLPDDMEQPWVTCHHQSGTHGKTTPWFAPGTAPVYGACGTLGGWPEGCHHDGKGHFGDCCSGNCDGFALGKNAEEYDWPGEIPVTEWFAGSFQEVKWYVSANHAGGYSYRLCKMPHGGIKDVTEECFQQTPLEFEGEDQWVVYRADAHSGHRTRVSANRTTEGTSPPGSMWTMNPLFPAVETDPADHEHGQGEVIDYVKVPETLEPGLYILGFRWDCKCSPQVWNVCSNILVI